MEQKVLLSQIDITELLAKFTTQVKLEVEKAFQKEAERHKDKVLSKDWLTAKQVESILQISSTTRWQWAKKGILKPRKIGSTLRYNSKAVSYTHLTLPTTPYV